MSISISIISWEKLKVLSKSNLSFFSFMRKRSSYIMALPQFFLIGSRHRNKTEAEDREVDKREEIGNASEPSEREHRETTETSE